jgi:hypothetical protein
MSREAMEMALDAITDWGVSRRKVAETVEALRAALAQPEPEPVAWFCKLPDNKISIKIVGKPTEGNWEPLYTAPPKKELVGLTHEEHMEILTRDLTAPSRIAVAEALLKEKNT